MRDENVFGIDQGIAIGLFEKPLRDVPARIEFREVWGSRASKLNVLASTDESLPAPRIVVAKTPHSFFVPQAASVLRENELENGFSLDAIMPTHSSAAVTARDGFVVGFSQQELRERLQAFSNLTISDDEIRRQYVHRTRSARYVRGDTRGWKMPAARVTASKTDDVDGLLQTVQYRPFDRRVIVWADWLIDWPRSDMMRPMLQADNIALVTRRQMLPGQACNFFFVTDTIVLDGLLRSDNRGNETFFPLYSFVAPTSDGRQFAKQHNFSIPFVERCAKQWRIAWLPTGAGDLALTFGPADLFALIYAQFFSSGYRERYAELLRNAFPRVFLPLDLGLLRSLCMLGNELIQTHLLRGTDPANLRYEVSQLLCEQLATGDLRIAGTYPRHDSASSRIELSAECYLSGISEEIWQYRFGAHQVCRKWLRDRKGRVLDKSDITTYCTIVHAVEQTLQCTAAIDQAIEASGGWPDAFAW
jgi:predicted helicase